MEYSYDDPFTDIMAKLFDPTKKIKVDYEQTDKGYDITLQFPEYLNPEFIGTVSNSTELNNALFALRHLIQRAQVKDTVDKIEKLINSLKFVTSELYRNLETFKSNN